MARVRRTDGRYSQIKIGKVAPIHEDGIAFEQALAAANAWFEQPDILAISSEPYPLGANTKLQYEKTVEGFTVGDAMRGFVDWKGHRPF